jgi:predicted O-methyltransferase YrrM
MSFFRAILGPVLFLVVLSSAVFAQPVGGQEALDGRVKAFLDRRAGSWQDLNVPVSDGKLLYDTIVKNGYRRALEIGTSTGHSAIWIAWALSRTGGRLITVEIDEGRYRTALANFREAGLSGYIDARLGDAHDLVLHLKGPFDFVFADADKDWNRNYFDALAPKLVAGGCYVTHNVSESRWGFQGNRSYVNYLKSLKEFETTFNNEGSGLSVSCRKQVK